MKSRYQLILLTFISLISVWTQTARAETIDCTAITSLPYTITTQGIYCLTGNLSTNMTMGLAIEIQTNNVTLDLNGYKLGGLGAGDSAQTIGIRAYQRKNITIKNGIVRGFQRGISLADVTPFNNASAGHVVENILADQNTLEGIGVVGLGVAVKNNTVVDTGGSTHSNNAVGILVAGSGVKVTNNTVSTTTAQTDGIASGIHLISTNSIIQNNTVTDTSSPSGTSYAIDITNSTGVFLRNNNVANADYGIYFTSSTGKYFNNLTFDVTTPFAGGTAVGSNNN